MKVKLLAACYPYDDPTIYIGVATTDDGIEKLRKQFVKLYPEFEDVKLTDNSPSELAYDVQEFELDGDYERI